MYPTKYGPFNGDTWEDLFQQIFKRRYDAEGYQEMVASPGDFGIEGYTRATGRAFQCYCPDKKYTQEELYEKQRDKITDDLRKLRSYQKQLKSRLGATKISEWIFVTPELNHNKLLAHAQVKEAEVKEWGLSIIDDHFSVLLKDGDFYSADIIAIQTINGHPVVFDDAPPSLELLDEDAGKSEYRDNIVRKNKVRCNYVGPADDEKLAKLNALTVQKWTNGVSVMRRIESAAPKVYYHMARVISQYQDEVEELSASSAGTPDSLVAQVKESLFERLSQELSSVSPTDQRKIADYMVSMWIAICQLDFD